MIAVLAPVAGVALGAAIEDVKQCSEDVTLHVAAAPEIAEVLDAHAKEWSSTAPPVDGTCVTVAVKAVDSPSMASAFARANDTKVDVGDAKLTEPTLPDVWVPESFTWLARFGGDLDKVFNERIDSVAESPVGLAVSQQAATDSQGIMSLNDTALAPGDPRADPASLALFMTGAVDSASTLDITAEGAKVMSQAAVTIYNAAHPDDPLVFMEPQPNLPRFEYPYVTTKTADAATNRAADAFRSSLLDVGFTNYLADRGLIIAGPYPQMPDEKLVDQAIKDWKSKS